MYGEYEHSLDTKGRVTFPAKLREELGGRFFITKGLDNCLFVYSEEGWAALETKIRALPMSKSRHLRRFFFAGASDVEPDKQGRVLIPANLRGYASLEKDVVIIGASDHAEIWDISSYRQQEEEFDADQIADAADLLEL